jgi:hypothetical protein
MDTIVNADDYGLNEHCSLAIAEAFGKGLITDTTIIANGEYFENAVELSKKNHFDDRIGIHFNITEGVPLTDSIKKIPFLVCGDKFHGRVNRIKPLSSAEKTAVYEELSAQISKVENAGVKVTHADSHHHIHTAIFIAPIVIRVCREHGINKIRLHRNIGEISLFKKIVKKAYNDILHKNGFITTRYFGSLEDIKNKVPLYSLEIMVHPDFDKSGNLIDRIGEENGIPIGRNLPDLTKTMKATFASYGDL